MSKPLLEARNVNLRYKTQQHLVTATKNVSFNVKSGDRFVLLGPSGCGKSTLLKAVGGYLAPESGFIAINDHRIKGPGPDRIFVFQEFDQLLPWKTVGENVAFALTSSKQLTKKEAFDKACFYINKVGLSKFIDSYPHTLSGGMKQRVAIARGMAMEPDILLMDEPFAALDALTRHQMQNELLRLWEEINFTVIFVTHSIEEAIRIGNKILLLSAHPGEVVGLVESNGLDHVDATGLTLSKRIHHKLFNKSSDLEEAAYV